MRQIVQEGVQGTVDLLKEFDELSEKFAEPMSDAQMTKLLEKQGAMQEKLEALNAWELDQQLDMAMDALRCPSADTKTGVLSGGEKRAGGTQPAAAEETGRADPR